MFAAEIFRDVFSTSDDATKPEARLGIGGNIIGEIFGILTIANNDDAQGGAAAFEKGVAYKPDGATKDAEQNKAGTNSIKSHDTNREKIHLEKKTKSNNSHGTDERGEKKMANLASAITIRKNISLIKTKSGENEDIERDHDEHGDDELPRGSLEIKWALIKMSADEISSQKGEGDGASVTKDKKSVEDQPGIAFHENNYSIFAEENKGKEGGRNRGGMIEYGYE